MSKTRQTNQHALNLRAIEDTQRALTSMSEPNGWLPRLALYSERGYPSGGDSQGGSPDISRPTERIALTPLDECARKYKEAVALSQQIQDAARRLDQIRLWATTSNTYKEIPPVLCANHECSNLIDRNKGEKIRNGRCSRCAMHHRRYGLEYPNKETVKRP